MTHDPAALALALAELRAAGEDEAADALAELLSADPEPVGKAMSTLTLSDGGALVEPAQQGLRRRRRKLKRCVRKALRELGD